MAISVNEFTLRGIGLAGIVGVVLNLILPKSKTAAAQDSLVE
jgi:xanthine/uracil permease